MKLCYFCLITLCLLTLSFRQKKLPDYCRWFFPIIFFALVTELAKSAFYENYRYVIQRVGQGIECFLLLGFYNQLLCTPTNKFLIKVSFIAYVASVAIYYPFFDNGFNSEQYFDYIMQSFLVCLLVCLYFFELLEREGELKVVAYAAFWLNAAHLVFYDGNFFAMALYTDIQNKQLKNIPVFLNMFLYTSYLLIFLFTRRKVANVS